MKHFTKAATAAQIAQVRDALRAAHQALPATTRLRKLARGRVVRIAEQIAQAAVSYEDDFIEACEREHVDSARQSPYGNSFSVSWLDWLTQHRARRRTKRVTR